MEGMISNQGLNIIEGNTFETLGRNKVLAANKDFRSEGSLNCLMTAA
jgi:hypothetical protein